MRSSCVVKPHSGGLFSNINKIVTCLRLYDEVYVDWSEGCPYGDCWGDLFDKPFHKPPIPYDIVTEYPFYEITAACAGVLYQNEHWGWREAYHKAWKRLTVNPEIQPLPLVEENTVGVMVRVDHHAGEQLSGRSQTHEEYARAYEAEKAESMYLMTSNEESLEWFKARFPVVYYRDTRRVPKRGDMDFDYRNPESAKDAQQVLREVLRMSTCKAMISPISNMATAALYINPAMKHIYLR